MGPSHAALQICDRFLGHAAVLHKIQLRPIQQSPCGPTLSRTHVQRPEKLVDSLLFIFYVNYVLIEYRSGGIFPHFSSHQALHVRLHPPAYHASDDPAPAPVGLAATPRKSTDFQLGRERASFATFSGPAGVAYADSAGTGFLRDAAEVGRATGTCDDLPALSDGYPAANERHRTPSRRVVSPARSIAPVRGEAQR